MFSFSWFLLGGSYSSSIYLIPTPPYIMHFPVIIKWIVIGLSMAAPIGPIGILCIRRSLRKRALSGFVSWLGTACVDWIYAAIALFGANLFSDFLLQNKILIQWVGWLFLLYLGMKIVLDKPGRKPIEKNKSMWLASDFLSTFLLTITNPMTIFALTAIFAGIDIVKHTTTFMSAIMLIAWIFLWSTLWRAILSKGTVLLKQKLHQTALHYINLISGIIIIIFACLLLWEIIFS